MIKIKTIKTGISTKGFNEMKKVWSCKNSNHDRMYFARIDNEIYISSNCYMVRLPLHAGNYAINKINNSGNENCCIVLDEGQCIMNYITSNDDEMKRYTKTADEVKALWKSAADTAQDVVIKTPYSKRHPVDGGKIGNVIILAIKDQWGENKPIFVNEKYLEMFDYEECAIIGSNMVSPMVLYSMEYDVGAIVMPIRMDKDEEVINAIMKTM